MVEGPNSSKTTEVQTSKSESVKKKSKDEKQPTKIVIRKLPGSMNEESFLECISPLFEHDYFYYVQNDNPSFGEHNYSRAYINFINVEDVFTFTMKFDDYVFLDDTGQEYPAVVEYASFQRIPKSRGSSRKSDSLCSTIDEDPDYQEFLSQLESEEQDHKPNQITEHYFDLANDENEEKVTTTPLLEYLTSRKNEWIKYKEEKKEERRRREMERKKMKEETKRIKKENKEAIIRAKIIEKAATFKDEKKKENESKAAEETKSVTTTVRIRGKSYQEERQRDLARRKLEEVPTKADENKENKQNAVDGEERPTEECSSTTERNKDTEKSGHTKSENYEYKKNYDDRKSHRDEDRKSSSATTSYSRDKDDKKPYTSYGAKKREYINGYEQDAKYRMNKSGGHYYDDYKNRGHSSYQKNTYVSSKYNKNKEFYDEKNFKRYDSKTKKYDHVDYKESSKKPQSEKDNGKKSSSTESKYGDKSYRKSSTEERKENENVHKSDSATSVRDAEENDDNYAESDVKGKNYKKDDKRDDRAERRIKNKDRPALEIYRPGMGKFSRHRLERNKSTDSKDGD